MELNEIRENLDRIDNGIIELLAQRMALIPKVIEYKQKHNIPRYQPEREKELIERLRNIAKENNLNPNLAEEFIRVVLKHSHNLQKETLD